MDKTFAVFSRKLATPFFFQLFLLTRLPVAFFCGLHLKAINEKSASITVRYRWFNQNPFRSMYFAVLAMAGEVSTGILAMGHLYKREAASMLLVRNEGSYMKKAVGKITFTCTDGSQIKEAIDKAIATKDATTCTCTSIGVNEQGEQVASFLFTWSFKLRSGQLKK